MEAAGAVGAGIVAVGATVGVTDAAVFVGTTGSGVAGAATLVAIASTGDAAGCGGTLVQAPRARVKVNSRAGMKYLGVRGIEISRMVITFRRGKRIDSTKHYRAESRRLP